MDSKIKILIIGDVRGRFRQLFQRVESINKKAGPFEIIFCVGEFFGTVEQNDELIAYKNRNKSVHVPTYILGPCSKETVRFYNDIKDGEICVNLTYLGKRGLYTLTSGVKVAYLSGLEKVSGHNPEDEKQIFYDKDDVLSLRNSCVASKTSSSDYKGVDILLTSQYPYGITDNHENASKLISFLCKEIKPRYHFCGLSSKYYEPPPFRIPSDQLTPLELCTRFISLAEVGNTAKEKYIYALSLTPVEKMRVLELIQKTTNETKCPFIGINIHDFTGHDGESENKQYFYDMNIVGDDNRKRSGGGGQRHDKRPRIMNIDQEKCWFCLSSSDVEKHLVISIGENFYLALAKGPINEFHVLIMSITHISSASLLSDDDWKELSKFKKALRYLFKSYGQIVCFTERHYKSSHLQINALGIDEGYAWKIKHAFEDKAEEFNLQFETLPALTSSQMLPQQGPYFVAELPDESTLITRQMKHFPLHFARDVFCSENLLNCEEKVDWKDCKLDKDKEIEMVKNFRKKFQKYDFTL
ncbi:CWF19-like protein 1 homolog [Zeugodacus cucurbitae]|uniref:CWF19-like protein 1 homolog n=1 Tax=Zeugodacus cucurbitae TaxID=28588 RepID=A0A0A1XE34_ZEUCU|nr:CWF19-like protein 1 homolog [Zeugodacus cucurbitae]XP_054088917.1 CWF19-like protein 1 homolog [Zeugodacus cucurbitae]